MSSVSVGSAPVEFGNVNAETGLIIFEINVAIYAYFVKFAIYHCIVSNSAINVAVVYLEGSGSLAVISSSGKSDGVCSVGLQTKNCSIFAKNVSKGLYNVFNDNNFYTNHFAVNNNLAYGYFNSSFKYVRLSYGYGEYGTGSCPSRGVQSNNSVEGVSTIGINAGAFEVSIGFPITDVAVNYYRVSSFANNNFYVDCAYAFSGIPVAFYNSIEQIFNSNASVEGLVCAGEVPTSVNANVCQGVFAAGYKNGSANVANGAVFSYVPACICANFVVYVVPIPRCASFSGASRDKYFNESFEVDIVAQAEYSENFVYGISIQINNGVAVFANNDSALNDFNNCHNLIDNAYFFIFTCFYNGFCILHCHVVSDKLYNVKTIGFSANNSLYEGVAEVVSYKTNVGITGYDMENNACINDCQSIFITAYVSDNCIEDRTEVDIGVEVVGINGFNTNVEGINVAGNLNV